MLQKVICPASAVPCRLSGPFSPRIYPCHIQGCDKNLPFGKFQFVSYQYLDIDSQLSAFSYVFLQQFRDNPTSSCEGSGTLKSLSSPVLPCYQLLFE